LLSQQTITLETHCNLRLRYTDIPQQDQISCAANYIL